MGSSSQVITQNTDRRISTADGDVLGLFDTTLTAAQGATINIEIADPAVAREAIASIEESLATSSGNITASVTALAKGSNEIAAQVAASQEQFVATASGQRYIVYALVVVVLGLALGVGIYFWRRKKP